MTPVAPAVPVRAAIASGAAGSEAAGSGAAGSEVAGSLRGQGPRRLPRPLHPAAWWLWALSLAVVADRTSNPVVLGLLVAAVGWVVARRRVAAPWARAFRWYLGLAATVIVIRVVFRVVFGGGVTTGGAVFMTLPQVPVPAWLAGIRLGGPVGVDTTVAAAVDGLRLGTLLCCVGAANALANPKRALRCLPAALEDLGVAVVVALSVAPQLVDSVRRVRRARRLRAGEARRSAVVRSLVVPVLEDALERSLSLAAAMESRGFGRGQPDAPGRRRVASGLSLAGLAAVCVGLFGVLDPGAPWWAGDPVVVVGAVAGAAGVVMAGRGRVRTRYRPDRWRPAEVGVVACGAVAVASTLVTSALDPTALVLAVPLRWPGLPWLAAAGIVVAAGAGLVAPPPPVPRRRAARPPGPVVPVAGVPA